MVDNPETRRLLDAFGVPSEAGVLPAWIEELDRLKTLERERRADVVGHEDRVAAYGRELALRVGFDEASSERIAVALLWHDVGKLRTPDELLDKTSSFTDEERERMKDHAADGASMMPAGAPEILLDVARNHHERYDGHGYRGLRGEEVSLASRIAQVADVYDALVSPRSYKEPMAPHRALLMMTADKAEGVFGRRAFDPYLLREFAGMISSRHPAPNADDARMIEDYVSSHPMADLGYLKGGPDAFVHRDGTRDILEFPDGSTPVVVRTLGPDGEIVGRAEEPSPARP